MPAARKTRHLLVLGVLVGVGAVAFAVWPRGSRLEWYTSPSFILNGASHRLQMLLPEGWKKEGSVSVYSQSTKSYVTIGVEVSAPTRSELMPDWFRGLVPLQDGLHGNAILMWQPPGHHDPDHVSKQYAWAQQEFIARRDVSSPLKCRLIYTSRDHAEFEATYRQICESLRVVR